MIIEIKVPDLGESIKEVEIGTWSKQVGDRVERDEIVVDVESEKATVEVPAPESGVIITISKQAEEVALIGEIIGTIDTEMPLGDSDSKIMPAAARVIADLNLSAKDVTPTGPGGRILKEDALNSSPALIKELTKELPKNKPTEPRTEERVRMSPIRRTIAARLLEAKQSTALLTTFNEIDMSRVIDLRKSIGGAFLEKHGVKLGFMSFFIKASVESLKQSRLVNARIDGTDIVYANYYDIGIAVGGGKGLVVPIIRDADKLSIAEIEKHVADLGQRASRGSITPEELAGGTFTISNGGIYGSMLSTPIINPPQSAILGLHAIKDRPVAMDGQVVIRPVMYVALSYDHRIIDGREAVTFLNGIKDRLEAPARLFMEI